MGKPFYFRLNPADLLSELIQLPTNEERGAWITRLAADLVRGESEIAYANQMFAEAAEFKRKNSEKGKIGMQKRWHSKTIAEDNTTIVNYNTTIAEDNTTIVELNRTVTSSSNSSSNNSSNKIKPKNISSEALRLSDMMADLLLANNSKTIELLNGKRDSTVRRWADDIDKLHRLDGQSWQDIEIVIRWVQADAFWWNKVMSGAKLREKWSKLSANALVTKRDVPMHNRTDLTAQQLYARYGGV